LDKRLIALVGSIMASAIDIIFSKMLHEHPVLVAGFAPHHSLREPTMAILASSFDGLFHGGMDPFYGRMTRQ
jgi:hypothetical protein